MCCLSSLAIEWVVVSCGVAGCIALRSVVATLFNGRGWSLHWSLHEGLLNSFRLLLVVTAYWLLFRLVLLVVLRTGAVLLVLRQRPGLVTLQD